jgi:hypothetical protein
MNDFLQMLQNQVQPDRTVKDIPMRIMSSLHVSALTLATYFQNPPCSGHTTRNLTKPLGGFSQDIDLAPRHHEQGAQFAVRSVMRSLLHPGIKSRNKEDLAIAIAYFCPSTQTN